MGLGQSKILRQNAVHQIASAGIVMGNIKLEDWHITDNTTIMSTLNPVPANFETDIRQKDR